MNSNSHEGNDLKPSSLGQPAVLISVAVIVVGLIILCAVVWFKLGADSTLNTAGGPPEQTLGPETKIDPDDSDNTSAHTEALLSEMAACPFIAPLGVKLDCLATGNFDPNWETIDGYPQRPIVLNVWATWCGPCRDELPVFRDFAKTYSDDYITAGIVINSSRKQAAEFLTSINATGFPSFYDQDNRFGITAQLPPVVPVTVVLNADNEKVALLPRTFATKEELKEAVDQALESQAR